MTAIDEDNRPAKVKDIAHYVSGCQSRFRRESGGRAVAAPRADGDGRKICLMRLRCFQEAKEQLEQSRVTIRQIKRGVSC